MRTFTFAFLATLSFHFNGLMAFDFSHQDVANYALKKSTEEIEIEKKVAPYLLPKKHFAFAALKQIFSKKGVLASTDSMEAAGFEIMLYRQGRGLIVASHPLLKNFLVKTYLDTATHVDWTRWVRRVEGRERIQKFFDENLIYNTYFKVPLKWIYQIPPKKRGEPTENSIPREYILLVENMDLVDKKTNLEMYQNHISYETLDGLYLVIDQTGFSDGHVANLPFSKDGKIAFIDTEYTNVWPVHFDWLTKRFCPRKQRYWEALIENKGPKRD